MTRRIGHFTSRLDVVSFVNVRKSLVFPIQKLNSYKMILNIPMKLATCNANTVVP